MGNNTKKRSRNHKGNNSPGMMAIVFVTVILLGSLTLESRDLAKRLTYLETKASSLERDIESEKQRTIEIDALRTYMKTDEYVEQVAREKLGLVKENEIVFVEVE